MTNTIERVRNYQGANSFVIKMKDSVSKYGSLTPKQLVAVEKCLNDLPKQINMDELPEDIKKIVDYTGENSFVKEIVEKFKKYGTLTERQKSAAITSIDKEAYKKRKVTMKLPVIGDTVKVGRNIGMELKEQYGLKFNPILIDVTRILAVTPKAVKLSGKMTVKRGDVCMCCAKTLTDEFSMLTRMGKTCAKHMGVEYITNVNDADRFREEYLKRVDEIGEFEFWIPNSQIKLWEGKGEFVVKHIQEYI
jgi:DNA-binding FrmR family transcriptional regulator